MVTGCQYRALSRLLSELSERMVPAHIVDADRETSNFVAEIRTNRRTPICGHSNTQHSTQGTPVFGHQSMAAAAIRAQQQHLAG